MFTVIVKNPNGSIHDSKKFISFVAAQSFYHTMSDLGFFCEIQIWED